MKNNAITKQMLRFSIQFWSDMSTKGNTWLLLLYIGFVGIASLLLVLWNTPYGAGITWGSATSIGGAKSLLSGKGYFINGNPITHFPPLYSLFLAAAGLVNSNFIQAARFLNAILFGINVGLVVSAVHLTAGRNFLTTTLAALFFLSSASILLLHSMAWSEPLFIALFFASIILLCVYVKTPTLPLLMASALTLGFATVTRYIGGAFILAALVIVFVSGSGQKLSLRFRNTLIWLVLACAPLIALFIRDKIVTGMGTDRIFVFHPLPMSTYVTRIVTNLFNFIAPIKLPIWVRTAFFELLAILLIALLIILFRRHLGAINWRSMGILVPVSCFLFSVSYLLFLYISISFFDANTPVDSRILSPVLLLLLVGAFSAMWTVSQILKKPILWWSFLFFVVLSITIKTPDAIQSARTAQEEGLGYTTKQWLDSESVTFAKSLGKNVKIYSNGADVLSLLAEKQTSYDVPYKKNFSTTLVNPLYNAEIKAMCKDIKEDGALLVYFKLIKKSYFPTQKELMSKCQLPVLQTFADGTVYGESYK